MNWIIFFLPVKTTFLKYVLIDIFLRERKEEEQKHQWNIDRLPPAHPLLVDEPATRARALTRNWTGPFGAWDDTQPSEPHWPGQNFIFYVSFLPIR